MFMEWKPRAGTTSVPSSELEGKAEKYEPGVPQQQESFRNHVAG